MTSPTVQEATPPLAGPNPGGIGTRLLGIGGGAGNALAAAGSAVGAAPMVHIAVGAASAGAPPSAGARKFPVLKAQLPSACDNTWNRVGGF